jgi:hypothetical protein
MEPSEASGVRGQIGEPARLGTSLVPRAVCPEEKLNACNGALTIWYGRSVRKLPN